MCRSRWAPQLLAPFAFPAPCDNQQHGLTLSCRWIVQIGDVGQGPHLLVRLGGHAKEAYGHPSSFQRSGGTAQANMSSEGDGMERGGLEASGPREGSDTNPHTCCQRSCFDDESSIAGHEQLQSQLPPLPVLQQDPRSHMEGVPVAVTHQGCPRRHYCLSLQRDEWHVTKWAAAGLRGCCPGTSRRRMNNCSRFTSEALV